MSTAGAAYRPQFRGAGRDQGSFRGIRLVPFFYRSHSLSLVHGQGQENASRKKEMIVFRHHDDEEEELVLLRLFVVYVELIYLSTVSLGR